MKLIARLLAARAERRTTRQIHASAREAAQAQDHHFAWEWDERAARATVLDVWLGADQVSIDAAFAEMLRHSLKTRGGRSA